MDDQTLRKVQLQLLEIVKEIQRVCNLYNIHYFMDSGTLLGAVRHKGFIPWDDDLDIGMLRKDYERFNEIAPKALGKDYFWQTWETDKDYPLPFGKVRKRNTLYVEKKSKELQENGFFVDILPYDFAPEDLKERKDLKRSQTHVFRTLLMKCNYQPWYENGKADYTKLLGYMPYKFMSLFYSKESLVEQHKTLTEKVGKTNFVYEQGGRYYYEYDWISKTIPMEFEGITLPAPVHYHEWLTAAYGDYMTPPPEGARENRHQVYKIDFGETDKQ